MTTRLDLDAHGRIVADEDHHSLATVLTRSGLPADRTPPPPDDHGASSRSWVHTRAVHGCRPGGHE
ncbi:hypothetical protein ACFQ1I_45715 [Kitasatospora arboriphila]